MIVGFTTSVNVVPVTQPVVVGVNVYVADRVGSTTAGFQVPVMPLVDVLDSNGTLPLLQITIPVPNGNTGSVLGFTTIEMVTGNAQVPGLGVNVYCPDVWLLTTPGFQVPGNPLLEVPGKEGGGSPAQMGGKGLKVGKKIGSLKGTPPTNVTVLVPSLKVKPVYIPAFRPVITTWPSKPELIVTGPFVMPPSI